MAEHTHTVLVTRVIDGDTFVGNYHTHLLDVEVDLKEIHFRMLDIQAPELKGETKKEGYAAKGYLQAMIEGKTVEVSCEKKDKYGRQLAIVYLDGIDINQQMLEKGYAQPYE